MRLKLHSITAAVLGLAFLCLLPVIPAMGAAVVEPAAATPEITVDSEFTDTIHIVAKNYAAKVDSDSKLINCIGPIKTRPDDGLVFVSEDTAIYLGLPSPETDSRISKLADTRHHIIILRNLNEGFKASRMFDLSKFDAVILNAPEVGDALTPQDLMLELGDKVKDFELHMDTVPNRVVMLTSPAGGVLMKKVDAAAGLYKTVLTFPATTLAAAIYWLEDATWALKAYNPRTNGKILVVQDEAVWKKMMSNENFVKEIKADKISAMVMAGSITSDFIKSIGKTGVQRLVNYSFTADDIEVALGNDVTKLKTTTEGVDIFRCLFPDIVLFWYQT